MTISIQVNNVRNIKSADLELPFEKGMYALVGGNGCGKSALMLLLSLVVKTSSSHLITGKDTQPDSYVKLSADGKEDIWKPNSSGKLTTGKYINFRLISSVHYHGFYEGSIFYGTRFYDYNKINDFFSKEDYLDKLIDADLFVVETLGYILQNNKRYYSGLKRIKSRSIAEKEGFRGVPYFYTVNNVIISQYQMSSGESMLLSLIDFINNLVIRDGNYQKLLFLIDEVELALHPAAIDRLHIFLNDLINSAKTELVVYFSTHSAELIQRIPAKNIYLLENDNGALTTINPCYPNYAVRNLYIPNGFDFVLLVEDELAKALVEKVIRTNNLSSSKLCCVLPAGGCTQMLQLHKDMVTYNTLGVGKHIVSIYDGDVKDSISKRADYKDLPKCFLPIPSIEKYLKKKLIDESDKKFIKLIGDKYFSQRPLHDIIADYLNDPRTHKTQDSNGKILYEIIISNLKKIGISEDDFIKYLCDDIYDYENPQKFVESLTKLLN